VSSLVAEAPPAPTVASTEICATGDGAKRRSGSLVSSILYTRNQCRGVEGRRRPRSRRSGP